MRWKRVIGRAVAECAALGREGKGGRPGFRVLLYHAVGSRLPNHYYGISIDPGLFERQMAILARTRWAHAVDLFAGQQCSSPSVLRVAVTFDDGFKDNLYTAAPILCKHHIPFTVFVATSYVRNHSSAYLTPTELRELAALPGVTIGSHGVTHVPLAECENVVLRQELEGSRRELEDMIGKPVAAIAYPHGSVNLRVREASLEAGYTLGVCSRFDINDSARDPLLLCRSEVIASDSERVFVQKLAGAWDWSRWLSRDPASLGCRQ